MKIIIFILAIFFLGMGCVTPAQQMQETIDEQEQTISELEKTIEVYEAADIKSQTRELLRQQRGTKLFEETEEQLLSLWQGTVFCGNIALCENDCEYTEYTRQENEDFCFYYYSDLDGLKYEELVEQLRDELT